MPWQLIYTSAPRLLTAGQTGFGTVARHRDIPALVASAVERASQFARLPDMNTERVVYCHRVVDAAGARYHILSRTASAGADYTGRTNHLAHHVILTAAEAAELAARRISAGDVIVRFPWRSVWTEAARWLEENETPQLANLPLDRHEHLSAWMEATGQALHANHLVTGNGARSGCIVIAPAKVEMRRLFAESLRAVPSQGWQFTFTTELDPGDTPTDFRWLGFSPGSPVLDRIQPGRRLVLDLTRPHTLPVAEPIAEKQPASFAAATSGRRAAPPRVVDPAGGAFVEPPVQLPLPLVAQMDGPLDESASDGHDHDGESGGHHDSAHGWRIVGYVALAACGVLGMALLATGKWRVPARKTPITPASEVSDFHHEPRNSVSRAPEPVVPPSIPTISTAPAPTPAPPRPAAPSPEVMVPLRAAHAKQLATLSLPELRFDQTHMLITATGEERGPLLESRGNLSLSLNDPTPVLKLNFATHRAEWSASPDSEAAPPVQWRVLKDEREILRVLIGDGSQRQPLNAKPVAATQDKEGQMTGAFGALTGRFGSQALWLRLPAEALMQLRECGYGGTEFLPLRNLRVDTSDVLAWVVKEQIRLQGIINAPPPEMPQLGSTPGPASSEPAGKAAQRSKQTNTLDNRPSPSSSVAGSLQAEHEQLRIAAQNRLGLLIKVREGGLLNGRLSRATCSFFAGPQGSAPEGAVWICDVTFNDQ